MDVWIDGLELGSNWFDVEPNGDDWAESGRCTLMAGSLTYLNPERRLVHEAYNG